MQRWPCTGKSGVALFHQALGTFGRDRPDHGDLLAVGAAKRQKGQNAIGRKPLACGLHVRHRAVHARGKCGLGVGGDVEMHAQLGACMAGPTFADDRQRCRHWFRNKVNMGLVTCGLGQTRFERRHIDDPCQCRHMLVGGVEAYFPAGIALHLHVQHCSGVLGFGPATQRFEQRAGRGIERIGANVAALAACGLRCAHQGDVQALAGQQQGECAADNASAADTEVVVLGHARIVEGWPRNCPLARMPGLPAPAL